MKEEDFSRPPTSDRAVQQKYCGMCGWQIKHHVEEDTWRCANLLLNISY